MPFIDHQEQFFKMRTKRQSRLALSGATADLDNDPTENQIPQEQPTTTINKKLTNYGDKFFVHYTYEDRFNTLKKDIHKVYDNIFHDTPAMYMRMIVGTRNLHDVKN